MTKKFSALVFAVFGACLVALGAVDAAKLENAKEQLKKLKENKAEITFDSYGVLKIPQFDSSGTNKLDALEWRIKPMPASEKDSAFTPLAGIPALGATWNTKLADLYGHVIGEECRAANIDAVLAKWLNFYTYDPNGGVAQSFGEDPTLTIKLSVSLIKAIQNHDVAAFIGSFCLEEGRNNIDSRTLHEIYLPVFRSAVKDAGALGLVASKEPYDEIPCCDNQYLVRGIMRGNWGFSGPIAMDFFDERSYMSEVDMVLDKDKEKCSISGDLGALRLFYIMAKTKALGEGEREKGAGTNEWHSSIARKVAEESIVLLKNDKSLLPIDAAKIKKIAILECTSENEEELKLSKGIKEYFLGSGKVEIIENFKLDQQGSTAEILLANPDIVFLFLPGSDKYSKDSGAISGNISLLLESHPEHVVAIESSSFGFKMPRLGEFSTFIHVPSPSEESPKALAKVVSGEINPSGRLNFTWPKESSFNIPIPKLKKEQYFGYREFDRYSRDPLFPFGHGLSYTSFRYEVDFAEVVKLPGDEGWSVSFPVRNIGNRKGMEVVQFYASYPNSKVERCEKELKGFAKTRALDPKESEALTIVISPRDLAYWDVFLNRFRLDAGDYAILVGASSGDIRGKAKISVSKDYVFED